jgi:hypothetical protein
LNTDKLTHKVLTQDSSRSPDFHVACNTAQAARHFPSTPSSICFINSKEGPGMNGRCYEERERERERESERERERE